MSVPGKVFLSCGQATEEERRSARAIAHWLGLQRFTPYVATQVQTILDLNGEIIRELKTSDFYLFINFRREPLGDGTFRGSLFAHQELAIAYALGFDRMLFVSQVGVRNEGMLGFIVSNVPEFQNCSDVLEAVKTAVNSAGWTPSFSRNLVVSEIRWGEQVRYGDHTGQRSVQVLYADISNRRSDLGAVGTVARLNAMVVSGKRRVSPDRSHLKATAYPGYAQTIFPESHGAFDILALWLERPSTLMLNSSLDVSPRAPLVSSPGEYTFEYQVFVQQFPILDFSVEVRLSLSPSNPVMTWAEAKLVGSSGPFLSSADFFRFGHTAKRSGDRK